MELNENVIREFYLCGGGSHELVEDEVIENCTVQILKCKKCGEVSIGWCRGGIKDIPEVDK